MIKGLVLSSKWIWFWRLFPQKSPKIADFEGGTKKHDLALTLKTSGCPKRLWYIYTGH
jgi:hypothetical protein